MESGNFPISRSQSTRLNCERWLHANWVDAGVDTGEIIAQQVVEIAAGDTEASLHERIKIAERLLIVEVLRELLPRVKAGR